jgi:hypothetical protein
MHAPLHHFPALINAGVGFGKPRSASEGRLQLDGGFLKNEAIHCYKHKSHCQIEPNENHSSEVLRAYPWLLLIVKLCIS